ncbi:MAG: cation transporter [Candidatus Accumulibacter sp.]|uniref:cation transporter n=1 Tax=Accumulibacter sp. TaxID=2053492 RepID=UPI0019DC06A7|nr:cation transporter [Accumulibacter sp.]MBE2259107.1 cation transporter [Paracoccaceae bacterium]MCB1942122.1 cation transporter [Accumulibacter sp.]MCP5247066.1 cation transporter [Accumulibacter sp.]
MTSHVLSIETRALAVGQWANLVMAVAGVSAAMLSRSDALLVDGLYSGVNFVSALIAARVARAVRRPADSRYPFGYDAYESLYVSFRALVLIGILVFALFASGEKILTYLSGGVVPALILGPILLYTVAMVVICGGLAWQFDRAWRRSGRCSDLLRTESRAAVVDGVLSAGAGAALLLTPLLIGTPAEGLVPIADALIVLVLQSVMLPQPLAMLRAALREVTGGAAEPESVTIARGHADEALRGRPFTLLDVAVIKSGRTHFVVLYVKPLSPVVGETLDQLREALTVAYASRGAAVRCEVVATASVPFWSAQPPAVAESMSG